MLCKVVLTFESVVESLVCDHLSESYWAVLSCGTVHYAVQGGYNLFLSVVLTSSSLSLSGNPNVNTLPEPLLTEAPYPEEVSASDMVEPRVEPRVEPKVEPRVLRKGENDPKDESRPEREVANCCISRWSLSLMNLCHAWKIFRKKPSFLARAWSLIRENNINHKQRVQKTARCQQISRALNSAIFKD